MGISSHFRRKTWGLSLSSAPFYASLLVIVVLGVFIGIFWGLHEYQAYKSSIDNIISNYNTQYRERVKEELEKVVDFIEYKRFQTDMQIENDLRDRVQSAYTIASHLYSLNKENYSTDEIRDMVKEVLRPIRWNNGKGYYFAGFVDREQMDLFGDEPYYEGKGSADFLSADGRMVLDDLTTIINDKGAGLYRYELLKPAFPRQSFSKITFVKYFKPFDWFIGAGIYSEDLERTLQEEVIERVQLMKFGNDGDVLGFRDDETIFVHSDERLIGRSVTDLRDVRGFEFGREMYTIGSQSSGTGYVRYDIQTEEDTPRQKMSFVQAYPDWNWILSAGMFMDEMDKAIAAETVTYETISFRNVSMFITLFVIAVFILLFAAYVYSRKIESGIDHFTDFFRQAASSKVKIKNDQLPFTEFEVIGGLANDMVDDRIQKELILQRNELRLDTLLRLGMMEKHSLQEKYDFVLRRIVQITESEGGYLALVNTNHTHLTICSYLMQNKEGTQEISGSNHPTRHVQEGGFPGRAIRVGKLVTGDSTASGEELYPYNAEVTTHLDVPVYDGDTIVLVCGVCNRYLNYDDIDIRQVSMLMEGLWLHVLKTCSEEELANLERQVIAISQDERSRIGQDLHDGLCSHLSGVELLSKALEQKLEKKLPDEAGQLGMIRGLIQEAIAKTGQLARGLYPVHVNDQGLEASLEELVTEVEGAYSVRCSLNCADVDQQWLDNNTATHIYYIAREAIFNAAKHGKPENIVVTVERHQQSFYLRVQDDGKGFVTDTTKRGMGLHTMKYRAKSIGATLSVTSDIVAGTTVVMHGEVE